MFCGKCGRQLPDNARFCRHCGKSTTIQAATVTPAAMPPGASTEQKTPTAGQQQAFFNKQQASTSDYPSTQAVLQKATNTNLIKTVIIVFLAAVVICAGILVIRGIAGAGKVRGAVENGNHAGQMIKVGKTTYMVLESSDRKTTQILKVDEKADSKAQEVYRSSWPKDGYIGVSLICIKGNTLYYLEYNSFGTDSQFRSFSEIKALNLKKEGSKPTTIELKLKGGKKIPESIIEAYENNNNKRFSLESLFEYRAGFEKNYIYSLIANETINSRVILFKIDCTNGEVSFIEGNPLGLKELWSLWAQRDGYLYYVLYDNKGSKGLFRARLSDLKEEKLIDALEKDTYFSNIRVMDNSLFYIKNIFTSKQTEYELHHFDLRTKKDTVVFTTRNSFSYNMSSKTIFYIEQGDLRSCKYDGSDDKLLIRNRDNAGGKSNLHILGDWIYYRQNGDWYRVKPGDGEFPSRSLN